MNSLNSEKFKIIVLKLNLPIKEKITTMITRVKFRIFTNSPYNGSQLKNLDISGAIFTLSLSLLILNFQCVEGVRDVIVF